MSALMKFNGGVEIKQELAEQIEQFFNYKWQNEKNIIFQGENMMILKQLPSETIIRILRDFLYPDFLKSFIGVFRFRNLNIMR